jgi:hypothetical protein
MFARIRLSSGTAGTAVAEPVGSTSGVQVGVMGVDVGSGAAVDVGVAVEAPAVGFTDPDMQPLSPGSSRMASRNPELEGNLRNFILEYSTRVHHNGRNRS